MVDLVKAAKRQDFFFVPYTRDAPIPAELQEQLFPPFVLLLVCLFNVSEHTRTFLLQCRNDGEKKVSHFLTHP